MDTPAVYPYHWSDEQIRVGDRIARAIADAAQAIIENAPRCPESLSAVRKLREAWGDVQAAIEQAS